MNVIQLYSAYDDNSYKTFINHILKLRNGTYLFSGKKNYITKNDRDQIKSIYIMTLL